MSDPSWADVETILQAGAGCMNGMVLTNDEGAFRIYLDDYESVVRFGELIAVVLDGWRRNAAGDAWAIVDGRPEAVKPHAMPPGGPLDIADVDTVKRWVAIGMPKDPAQPVG
ncbi:MAG: hypothetical protein RIB45_07195 [Marivibrio sp.]|uniref:hypothetical protein n=1 Tax=Marivibrio sp. TaxID=2039719 RepID=UPI0032EE39F3